MCKAICSRCVAFLRDERGNISIETLILMPLLIFLTLLGINAWNAFNSHSRTAKVAYTVADIASRYTSVDNTDMAELVQTNIKLLPQDVTNRQFRISSICFENGAYQVLWSFSSADSNQLLLPALKVTDIPTEILPAMSPQDSVLLVETRGRWNPKLSYYLTDRTWRNALVIRPRFVKIIPHSDLNPSNVCPSSTT